MEVEEEEEEDDMSELLKNRPTILKEVTQNLHFDCVSTKISDFIKFHRCIGLQQVVIFVRKLNLMKILIT